MSGGIVLRGAAIACLLGALWVVLFYGLGQVVLGRMSEPASDIAPRSLLDVPQDRALHILFLGTSLTATGDWIGVLGRKLSGCRAAGVVVERLARPGANSAWGEVALRNRLASGQAPDILVVEFSINDSSLWRGMTWAASRARHEAILNIADQAGMTVWLATMSPAFGRKAWERPGQVAYRALYEDLARLQGRGLIAMASVWQEKQPENRQIVMPDGLHPTAAAMAEFAVPVIFTALKPSVCGPA